MCLRLQASEAIVKIRRKKVEGDGDDGRIERIGRSTDPNRRISPVEATVCAKAGSRQLAGGHRRNPLSPKKLQDTRCRLEVGRTVAVNGEWEQDQRIGFGQVARQGTGRVRDDFEDFLPLRHLISVSRSSE